ncbi:MAG: flagellin [Bacillota bacterium]|jgi:flagellin
MRIYNNITAMTAYRSLMRTDSAISKSMERLSSGLKINSAADDATGLVISEKMRNQITGFNQAIQNAQQGMSMLKTAEGAMGQQHELLGRIRELVLSSNNDFMTDDNLQTIQNEIDTLVEQIDDIANNTTYNGKNLMDGTLGSKLVIDEDAGTSTVFGVGGVSATITGTTEAAEYTISQSASADGKITMTYNGKSQTIDTGVGAGAAYKGTLKFDVFGISLDLNVADIDTVAGKLVIGEETGSMKFQVGADDGQNMSVSINDMLSTNLGISSGNALKDVKVFGEGALNFTENLAAIDQAVTDVGKARADMGSYITRFQASMNNLQVAKENLQASESLIRDLDMADEMVQLTRNQVLSQASTAMLAQANQRPQAILQLLG